MRISAQYTVYMVGVVLFALLYGPVKNLLGGGWVFIAFAIAYLVLLRLIGAAMARTLSARHRGK